MSELKRCPFCGGEAILIESAAKVGAWVRCTNCRAESSAEPTAEDATETWNRRVQLGIRTDWIKVTPETMPPDMKLLLVTAVVDGKKTVIGPVRKRGQFWEYKYLGGERWLFIKGELITHWMLVPAPAED